MQLAMVGLGRMGGNMAQRLIQGGHAVVVYDRSPEVRSALAAKGGTPVDALTGVVDALPPPRVVWLMLPAGQVTSDAVATLEGVLSPGDVIVDGAQGVIDGLGRVGVDFADVAKVLEDEGVGAFSKSFDELIQALTDKANALRS